MRVTVTIVVPFVLFNDYYDHVARILEQSDFEVWSVGVGEGCLMACPSYGLSFYSAMSSKSY
jgi:hypothetical protein